MKQHFQVVESTKSVSYMITPMILKYTESTPSIHVIGFIFKICVHLIESIDQDSQQPGEPLVKLNPLLQFIRGKNS